MRRDYELGITLSINCRERDTSIDYVEIWFIGQINVAYYPAWDCLSKSHDLIRSYGSTGLKLEWGGVDRGGGQETNGGFEEC
jgi:hypothetical protein